MRKIIIIIITTTTTTTIIIIIDNMFQEKREKEDLPALKTALTHRYNSKIIYKNTMEDSLLPSETIMITRLTTE